MGKKTRERKTAKLEQIQREKKLIEVRKAEKLRPIYRTVRKIVMTLTATALLLYLGVFINAHLQGVINRILGRG